MNETLKCASNKIRDLNQEDAFLVMDLGVVKHQLDRWRANLPRADPWFAVKCCPDPGVMRTLAEGGCGFDVASKAELEAALSMPGASPERLIYANPCKQPSHIRAAAERGVNLTTFDNVEEMRKVHKLNPNARLVVRILGDDSSSVCRFNVKFGIAVEELEPLLLEAVRIGANVVGVSFHVGSGCRSADAFVNAVENARIAFDLFVKCGLTEPKLLDLGGGWPGDLEGKSSGVEVTFEQICAKLAPALDRLFPSDVQIIAEPGRYFVHASAVLFVNVTAKRRVALNNPELTSADSSGADSSGDETDNEGHEIKRARSAMGDQGFRYYVNDGCYGSFNCIMYDHRENLCPAVVMDSEGKQLDVEDMPLYDCSVFGNTCDGIDRISASCLLPDVPIGTWMGYTNMGAYTSAAASSFNGFSVTKTTYV
jgi:ornithine decarboxylase